MTADSGVEAAVREAAEEVLPEYDVVAAYLYGSYARGEEHAESDVDIAVYFQDYTLGKLLEVGRRLEEEAGIGREVDVRALNRAGPEFSFTVIQEGVVVYETGPSRRADIEQRIERRYHDMKPLIQDYRAEMKRRLARHG